MELLIKSGALEDFGKSKNTLLQNIDSALTYVELVNSLDESLVLFGIYNFEFFDDHDDRDLSIQEFIKIANFHNSVSIKGITAQQSKAILDVQPFDDYFDFFKKTYQKGVNRTADMIPFHLLPVQMPSFRPFWYL